MVARTGFSTFLSLLSLQRSGEAMEKALQDCCRSMRIGKILVDSDSDTHEAHVVFAKFPDDIANRKVRQFSREKIHIA